MTARLFFYGNALDDMTRQHRGVTTDSPAGTRKMLNITRALRTADVRVVIVSMGRGRSDGSGRYHASRVCRIDGIPVIYGPMLHRRGLSELLTVAWLAWIAILLGFRFASARHLFYNQFSAYLPALAALRIMGKATVCDIEDGPVSSAISIASRSRGNAPPGLFSRLISSGALLACEALAEGTRIRPVICCYGAVKPSACPPKSPRSSQVVVMTGMFDDATGVALLEATFEALAEDEEASKSARFEFAGFGPRLTSLREAAERHKIHATFHGRLDAADYARLLARASIGLSLKAIEGPYANSTFPSKVIEYAENGLCVITTDISDVRAVLGNNALYLHADEPRQLVAHLRWASERPRDIAHLGQRACEHLQTTRGYQRVGEDLRAFLFK